MRYKLWRSQFALIIATVHLGWASVVLAAPAARSSSLPTGFESSPAPNRPLEVLVLQPPEAAREVDAKVRAEAEKSATELALQERATRATEQQVWAAWFGAVFAIISTIFVLLSLDLARRANRTARDALLGDQRPHLRIRRIFFVQKLRENGRTKTKIRLEATNCGKSPAIITDGHIGIETQWPLPASQSWWGHLPTVWDKSFLESATVDSKPIRYKRFRIKSGCSPVFIWERELSSEEELALLTGKLTILGFVSYHDVSRERQYHTDFARRYDVKSERFERFEDADYESET